MSVGSFIDRGRCGNCGNCVAVCPAGIPHWRKAASTSFQADSADKHDLVLRPERLHLCIQCGHCMAICPSQAIHIDGLSYRDHIFDLPRQDLEYDRFHSLLLGRRSARVFKDQPVPRGLLEQILEAISLAPMSFPPHKVEVTVVQQRETMEQALPLMVDLYEKLEQWLKNPVISIMIRRRAGREAFSTLKSHVLPTLPYRLPETKAGVRDTITRGAPAMLLFHTHQEAIGRTADAYIALTYGLLAAEALGLGATAISLVPPVVERSPELRALFKIPAENKVLACMILGYPKLRFKRGIRRDLAGVNWI